MVRGILNPIKVGDVYGNLTIISIDKDPFSPKGRILITLACNCGKIVVVHKRHVGPKGVVSCGDTACKRNSRRLPELERKLRKSLYDYTNKAKARNTPFLLTRKAFERLVLSPNCYYCGEEGKNKTGLIGIDRKDNSQGYTENNCVPCCKECNRRKLDNDLPYLYDKIYKIALRYENGFWGPSSPESSAIVPIAHNTEFKSLA